MGKSFEEEVRDKLEEWKRFVSQSIEKSFMFHGTDILYTMVYSMNRGNRFMKKKILNKNIRFVDSVRKLRPLLTITGGLDYYINENKSQTTKYGKSNF
jgi:hypothetical protein